MDPYITQNFHAPIYAENVGIIYEAAKLASTMSRLEPYVNHSVAFNSIEREKEEAIICEPGTRTRVLNQIQGWVRGDGPSVMWLYGPAGAGKSTIAHTIAQQCDTRNPKILAFSYFFSRRNLDRSDLTKFIPTFAYQLVRTVPSLAPTMLEVCKSNPSVFHQRIRDQVQMLIINPLNDLLRGPPQTVVPTMVVVIDGLDEYSGESGGIPLSRLVQILVLDLAGLPFRFFFASRPELYICSIFDGPLLSIRTMIPISDWDTENDIYNYLFSKLSEVQRAKRLPSSWPSYYDVKTLVNKSEGIFIYASTLIKFVGANNCNSKDRLQKAMKSHNGLDSLFVQVLDSAREHEDFQYTLGIIMFLRKSLPIGVLARFLQRGAYDIRSSLEGSLSIIMVPETDEDYIRPYHASLQDFLNDHQRSGDHFLDPMIAHAALAEACANLIAQPSVGEHLDYAYKNWYHHLLLMLSSENRTGIDRSSLLGVSTELAKRPLSQHITWFCAMESYKDLEGWRAKLHESISDVKRESSFSEGFLGAVEQLQNTIGNFLETYHKNFFMHYPWNKAVLSAFKSNAHLYHYYRKDVRVQSAHFRQGNLAELVYSAFQKDLDEHYNWGEVCTFIEKMPIKGQGQPPVGWQGGVVSREREIKKHILTVLGPK